VIKGVLWCSYFYSILANTNVYKGDCLTFILRQLPVILGLSRFIVPMFIAVSMFTLLSISGVSHNSATGGTPGLVPGRGVIPEWRHHTFPHPKKGGPPSLGILVTWTVPGDYMSRLLPTRFPDVMRLLGCSSVGLAWAYPPVCLRLYSSSAITTLVLVDIKGIWGCDIHTRPMIPLLAVVTLNHKATLPRLPAKTIHPLKPYSLQGSFSGHTPKQN